MRNRNRIIVGHLNLISETKLDNSFPNGQFLIKGCSTPYRLDGNAQGGRILLFIMEDISSKLVAVEDSPIEGFYVEINLRKKIWLLCCFYSPQKSDIQGTSLMLEQKLGTVFIKI